MKSRKLILIALASCIFPSGCDRFHRRPDNVPSSAVWIDGAFIDCTATEHSNANRCTVFKDKTGEVLAEGLLFLILAASAGCRIGELLGLEIKDLLDDFTTVRIIQQAKGKQLTTELKTANSVRFVDISPEP